MTHEEIIVGLTDELLTLKKAYKYQQDETDKYTKWWSASYMKCDELEAKLKEHEVQKDS